MDKRQFLKTTSMAAAGCAIGMGEANHAASVPKKPKFWAWVTTDLEAPDEEWKRRFSTWKAHGLDAILPEVVSNRTAHYASAHLPVSEPWLERLLPIARTEGLEVHCWMHTMACTMDSVHAEHPEWYNVNRNGDNSWDHPAYVGYYRFLCPSRPGVHEFLQKHVRELSAFDVDGVHLDYIRYPDVILAESLQPHYDIVQDKEYPQYDYCYCDVCRAGFAEMHGVDPLEMEDPTASSEWFQYRCDLITSLVNDKLIPVGREAGKQMTAAVFPNWQHVRQQWGKWKLDHVLPMLYHRFYNADIPWIGEKVREEIAFLDHGEPLSAGVMLGRTSAEDFEQMIEVSLAAGAAGLSVFNAGDFDDEKLLALKAASGA
jgi:uncharacterized lipoprotein YddW (UPF0748 family)